VEIKCLDRPESIGATTQDSKISMNEPAVPPAAAKLRTQWHAERDAEGWNDRGNDSDKKKKERERERERKENEGSEGGVPGESAR